MWLQVAQNPGAYECPWPDLRTGTFRSDGEGAKEAAERYEKLMAQKRAKGKANRGGPAMLPQVLSRRAGATQSLSQRRAEMKRLKKTDGDYSSQEGIMTGLTPDERAALFAKDAAKARAAGKGRPRLSDSDSDDEEELASQPLVDDGSQVISLE